ncbi:hypothetical protein D3C80_2198020 [compost metagenome]
MQLRAGFVFRVDPGDELAILRGKRFEQLPTLLNILLQGGGAKVRSDQRGFGWAYDLH